MDRMRFLKACAVAALAPKDIFLRALAPTPKTVLVTMSVTVDTEPYNVALSRVVEQLSSMGIRQAESVLLPA